MQAAGGTLVKHYKEMAFMGFIEVIMNLNEFYTDPHDDDHNLHPRMIMMNTAVQDTLEANAASVFSLGVVSTESARR